MLEQLHGQQVVTELERALQRELPPEPQQQVSERVRLHSPSKYSEQQPASVLVERLRLVLQLARLPVGSSGSKSPTLQVQRMDLLGIARTSHRRANHLHQNLVLKTQKRSFAFSFLPATSASTLAHLDRLAG